MEKLTRKQKLELVREARKNFINLVKQGDSLGLCFSLSEAYAEIWGERVGYKQIREDILPEMVKHKPEGEDVKESWWRHENTEVRIYVFNKLEYEFLPWHTKLYNQIKNLFK